MLLNSVGLIIALYAVFQRHRAIAVLAHAVVDARALAPQCEILHRVLSQDARTLVNTFPYVVMAMPFAAFVFGHMATIVGLGSWRIASRKLRRLRKAARFAG